MKARVVFILVTLLSIIGCAYGQQQSISRLKTQTITLSREVSDDKKSPTRSWILAVVESRDLKPAKFKGPPSTIDNLPSTDVTNNSDAMNVGQVQIVPGTPRRYSIRLGMYSPATDETWLQLEAVPDGGMGLLVDMGQMNWADVDRMPDLVLKPVTSMVSFSNDHGVRNVGPQGLIVMAVAGHVYAARIKDDRTDYRVIFRIDSVAPNGDCSISWKRVPSK